MRLGFLFEVTSAYTRGSLCPERAYAPTDRMSPREPMAREGACGPREPVSRREPVAPKKMTTGKKRGFLKGVRRAAVPGMKKKC